VVQQLILGMKTKYCLKLLMGMIVKIFESGGFTGCELREIECQ
jgi:hypothetical protein